MNRFQAQLKDGSKAAYGVQVMHLQQQVADLSSSLADVNGQKTELEKSYTQLQIKLEHYKRYLRNQDRDYKVRREIEMLLQNKNADNFENAEQVS